MTKKIAMLALLSAIGWIAIAGAVTANMLDDTPILAYPLDYCIVSGEALGSMGKPVSLEHAGRQIQFCCGSCVKTFKADPDRYLKEIDEAVMKMQRPLYPLTTCVVDGKPLGATPIEFLSRYTLVRVDSEACRAAFLADPKRSLAALEQAVIAKQRPTYPLDTCVVTGEKLGEMGDPIEYVYQGRLVRFCCSGCIKTFEKDPAAYLKQIVAPNPPSPSPTQG